MIQKLSLPPGIERELRMLDHAFGLLKVDYESVAVIKTPNLEARSLSHPGLVIRAKLLYAEMRTAPVICLVCYVEGDPDQGLLWDAYFNYAHQDQRYLLAHLTSQDTLKVFILNEDLNTVVAQAIPWGEEQRLEALAILNRAAAYQMKIPAELYDFARAKAEFQPSHALDEVLDFQG